MIVRIDARPDLLGTRTIDLRSRRRPDGLRREQTPSFFFNYAARGVEVADESLRTFLLSGELGGSAWDTFGYSSFSTRPDGRPVRGLTRFSFDLPEELARFTIGDDFNATSSLGGGAFVGGLHFARRFEMDPWLLRTPLPSLSGAAETPSTLEVYTDGTLVRREHIAPGTFEIHNLPVTAGSGETHYVLRDAFGRETRVVGGYTVGASLLGEGLHDFAWSFGFRRQSLGTRDADYSEPVLLGVHRLGLADWITGGMRVEAAHGVTSGGGSLVLRLPLGLLSLEGAGSRAEGRNGLAGTAGWALSTRSIGLSLWSQAMSDEYAHTSLEPTQNRALFDGGAGISVPLGRIASANLRSSYRHFREGGGEARQDLHVHWRLLPGLALSTSGSRSEGARGVVWESFATLTVALPRNGTAQLRTGSGSRGESAGFSIQEHAREEIGWDYRVAMTQAEATTVDARAGYRGTKGQARAELFSFGGEDSLSVEASGSIVAMDDRIFLSRPVQGSFALVRVPGVPDATVRLNNREVGPTDERGDILVVGLQSYDGNKLSVDARDIPFDRSIDRLAALVAPPRGGGATVVFDARPIRLSRGHVVALRAGGSRTPISHAELSLRVADGERSFILGSRGQFEIDLPAGTYEGTIRHSLGSCTLKLQIPETESPFVDIGEIPCRGLLSL